MFADVDPGGTARVASAAFGLHPTNHWGRLAADADDPVPTATPWEAAPRADVPVTLRQRGDTTNRGVATPLRDRSREQAVLRRRREQEQAAARRVEAELLALGAVDGSEISSAALVRLQELVGRALNTMPIRADAHTRADGLLACTVERVPGSKTTVNAPQGALTFLDLQVRLGPTGAVAPEEVARGR
jgi:hypothetical protein